MNKKNISKTYKRVFALLLAFVMMVGAFPATVFADEPALTATLSGDATINVEQASADEETTLANETTSTESLTEKKIITSTEEMLARVKTNSEQKPNQETDGPATWAFDDNESSYWHSRWNLDGKADDEANSGKTGDNPIWIQIGFGRSAQVSKLTYAPRDDQGGNVCGKDYKIYIANLEEPTVDPEGDIFDSAGAITTDEEILGDWKMVKAGELTRTIDTQTIELDETVTATHVRIVFLSAYRSATDYTDYVSARMIEIYEVPTCSHVNTEVQGAKEATCTETGYTGNTICKDCEITVSAGTETEATGHTYGDWVVTKAATRTEAGEQERNCTACGNKEMQAIEATGKYTADDPFVFPTKDEPVKILEAESAYELVDAPGSSWAFGVANTWAKFLNAMDDNEDTAYYAVKVEVPGTYKVKMAYRSGNSANSIKWSTEEGSEGNIVESNTGIDVASTAETCYKEFTMTADKAGAVTLVLQPNGNKAPQLDYFEITYVAATAVTLAATEVTLTEEGATATLAATVAPDNATCKDVTWTSSDETVATVDASGVVTAVGEGTATITATAEDISATCKVVVDYPSEKLVLTVEAENGTAYITHLNEEALTGDVTVKNDLVLDNQVTVTAVGTDEYEFLYWFDTGLNRIVSRSDEYTFTMIKDTNLKAVFEKPYKVVFKTSVSFSNKEVQRSSVTSDDTITVPEAPVFTGYEFVGWDSDGNGAVDEIEASYVKDYIFTVTEDVTFEAVYRAVDKYSVSIAEESGTLTVVSGSEPDAEGKYVKDTILTATANSTDAFSGWYVIHVDEETNEQKETLVSVNSTYRFYVKGDTVLVARYGGELQDKPVVAFNTYTRTRTTEGKEKIRLQITWEADEKYEVIGAGIIRTYNEDITQYLRLGTTISGIKTHVASNIGQAGSYAYNFTIGVDSANKLNSVHARGYLRYIDGEGNIQTIYTDPVELKKLD